MSLEAITWVAAAIAAFVLATFVKDIVFRPVDWLWVWLFRGERLNTWQKALGVVWGGAIIACTIALLLFLACNAWQ